MVVQSIPFAGREIPFLKVDETSGGHYIAFLQSKTGLHISIHPNCNPHLKDKVRGKIAELDIEEVKKLSEEDVMSLFAYPGHNSDVNVVPLSSFDVFQSQEIMTDPIRLFDKFFAERILYKMRARRLAKFFRLRPKNYIIMDPVNETLFIQFEGSPYPPLSLGWKEPPGNDRMKKVFALSWGVLKYHMDLPDSGLDYLMPDESMIAQWVASMVTVLGQVQVVRWNKGGVERRLGTILPPMDPKELAQLIDS